MKILSSILFILICSQAIAQDDINTVTSYLNQNLEKNNFDIQDIADIKVTSSSYSKSLDAHTVYITQYHQGIEVLNSSSSFLTKGNEVLSASLSFQKNIASRIDNVNTSLTPENAINQAINFKELDETGILQSIESQIDGALQFTNPSLSNKAITIKPIYVNVENNLQLSWQVYIETLDNQHMYLLYIDAINGDLINEQDLVINCTFSSHDTPGHQHSNSNEFSISNTVSQDAAAAFMNNSRYNVYAIPLESPNHGNESLVTNPSDPIASPFGWHDTNGIVGPEFTITRGNNVYAQEDLDGDGATFGNAPDGTIFLNFNISQQLDVPAIDNIDGSTVNLFYMNNIMHDVWYQYGFDEASGNFQANNYNNGGIQGDFVIADAQDGSGFNNATFGTPADGGNPRMNMFLWSAPSTGGVNPLTINNSSLAGSYNAVPANFGTSLPNLPMFITGDLTLVADDNSGTSTDSADACDPIINGTSLSGKIAVLRRGGCQFGAKVLAAENEGAIAVIVINNVATAPIAMAPGNDGDLVTIPSVMISQSDGAQIISQLQNGTNLNVNLNSTGLFRKDGSLDNGIVAHEYGHGISTRLTGGATNSSCLSNIENMGEGWSDWFALMLTIEPGDLSTDARGIGTYATNQSVTGPGIRNFPYSTDTNINPVTFGDTNNANFSVPHGVGSIWASILWDLSWRFITDYGYDPDLYNGTGGNNIAMQLVIDGLKLQPCSPGFVDGRDAIILADRIANGGVNRDRIWQVFANRGLGLSASSGSTNNRFDQIEAFDVPDTLGVTDIDDHNFNVFPNPSTGLISIVSQTIIKNGTLNIYDFNGRLVYTKKTNFNDVENLDLNNLTSGVYLVTIKGENTNHVTKIIIE